MDQINTEIELPVPTAFPWSTTARGELDAARRLAERYGLEFIDMDTFRIDQELFRSIPADLMLRYGFVPYRREGKDAVDRRLGSDQPADARRAGGAAGHADQGDVGPRSAIDSILKKSESSTARPRRGDRELSAAAAERRRNGDDNLTVERLTSDISPVIRLVDSTIYTAIQRRASDIHIETQDDAVT